MSDLDPVADADKVLKDLENEIIERLKAGEEMANRPVMDSTVGRLTYIDAYQQQQVALHARRKLELKLERVKVALARVSAGTYGTCVRCGVAIPPERLEFVPEVAFCVKCNEGSRS